MPDTLTILAITDPHYANQTAREQTGPERGGRVALELISRAIDEARRFSNPDVVVLLGDTVNDGAGRGGEMDLAEVAETVRKAGLPAIVVPGNHDGAAEQVLHLFQEHAGAHHIKGYTLYTFADPYAADDAMTRPREAIREFLEEPLAEPIIVLQHSPIYPAVPETDYPYMPQNPAEIMDSYRQRQVVLSLSGHYHAGQGPVVKDGTTYVTCAALYQAPYPYALIQVNGRNVTVERHVLRLPEGSAMVDGHVHTHFGYCAVDVHPAPVIERVRMFGLRGVQCVEHAGQVYLTPDEFWHKVHVDDPQAILRARARCQDRMSAFRAAMAEFRSDRLRVGLEVEVDRNGDLTLLPEDRQGWDVLLGAVHWLPSSLTDRTAADRVKAFMTVTEQLIGHGIDVLAHPFRYFDQKQAPTPVELYRPLAKALKARNVAAEINFHFNRPDPEFFRICAEEGVRLVAGSDGHLLREVADLHPHARLLQEIGVPLNSVGWGADRR